MHVILLIKHSEYEFQRFIVRNWRRGEIGKERERGKNLQYIDHLHLKYKVIQSLDLREQMKPLDHFHLQKKILSVSIEYSNNNNKKALATKTFFGSYS